MSLFTIKLDTSNAAFDPSVSMADLSLTLAHTLREVARKVEAGRIQGPIHDLNGNTVGTFQLSPAPAHG